MLFYACDKRFAILRYVYILVTKDCHFMTIIEEKEAKSIVEQLVENLICIAQIEIWIMVSY